jgi:xylulokinase
MQETEQPRTGGPARRADRCVLAMDLGGSSLRVALVRGDGAILALRAAAQSVPAGPGGACEAATDSWWDGLAAGVEALRRDDSAAFGRVAAVAVTAFTRGLVLVDAAGRSLRPALLWNDTRAAAALPDLAAMLPEGHAEARHLNAFHPLARLAWLAREEPELVARAAAVLEPKDEINRRLTGRIASDRVSSARLAASAGLLPRLGLSATLLPRLLRPIEIMGRVRPGLPGALGTLAGLPVIAMANDTWAAVTGLGAMRPGLAYCISGTTEVLGLLHTAPAEAAGLLTVEWDGLWQIGGPSQHGADALTWLRSLGVRDEDAAQGDPGPLLFLPTLSGERVPHWDPLLRGAFLGLNRRHGPADLARAVMQGVAFNNRTVLGRAEAAAGIRAAELRLGGGGATPAWAQIRADVLGRPVVVTESPEPGLLGCAITAFAALEGAPVAALQEALSRPAARFLPDPGRHAAASRLHAVFLEAEAAVAPISRRLAALGAPPG